MRKQTMVWMAPAAWSNVQYIASEIEFFRRCAFMQRAPER